MAQQLNKEGWHDIDQDPGTPAALVVVMLKEFVPRNGEASGTPSQLLRCTWLPVDCW